VNFLAEKLCYLKLSVARRLKSVPDSSCADDEFLRENVSIM